MSALNWCEIYIEGKATCKKIADIVLDISKADITYSDGFSRWDFKGDIASISVERNDDYTPFRERTERDFLCFPFIIDAGQLQEESKLEYENLIRMIAKRLESNGLRVSVIADFNI